MSGAHDIRAEAGSASSPRRGDRWRQISRDDVYVVTRVGNRKLTMVCRRPNFDITLTAWIERLASDPDWQQIGER